MTPIGKRLRDFLYRFRPLPSYYGDDFKRIYEFLQHSRWWRRERVRDYKLRKLKELIEHAEKNVPYYRELFAKHGIKAKDINSFKDFAKIPVLTKGKVQENIEQLKAVNFESYNPLIAKTSATSGAETILFRSAYLESFRKAVIWRIYNEYGFDFRDKKATITNPHSFEPDAPVYEYDKLENELVIDTSHLVARHFDKAYQALKDFNPKMIWSHPNMLGLLAEYIHEKGLEPLEITLIGTYAVKFDPALKDLTSKVIKGRYFEYYGNRENTIAAWGDSNGEFFEVSEYCHFELENAISVADYKRGDLITTSLHNYAFPLIRYHSEDVAEWLGKTDPSKPYPAIRLIGGRGKDLLVSKEGLIDIPVLGFLQKNDFDKISNYQIEQISLQKIIFRGVVRKNFDGNDDKERLYQLLKELLPDYFEIEIEYVKDIRVTPQGKSRMVISPLAMDYLNTYTK